MALISLTIPHLEARWLKPTEAFILEGECIITKTKKIAFGRIGATHLLTGHDPKTGYNFVACFNQYNNVAGISKIFSKLEKLGVNLKDLEIKLLGGWATNSSSDAAGARIREKLKENRVDEVCINYFQRKTKPIQPLSFKLPKEQQERYYYLGGHFRPKSGALYFNKQIDLKIEKKQLKQHRAFTKEILKQVYPDADFSDCTRSEKTLAVMEALKKDSIPLTIWIDQ
jgi:hypothetical protein